MNRKASLIIPTIRTKKRFLILTLHSLLLQNIEKKHFEVILIGDKIDRGLKGWLTFFSKLMNLRYIEAKNRNRAQARNLGIRRAKGKIIIFTDDDLLLPKDFLNQHLSSHGRPDKKIVLGKVFQTYTSEPEKIYSSLKKPALLSSFQKSFQEWRNQRSREDPYFRITRIPFRYKENPVPWIGFGTNNASLSRKDLFKTGLFDETFKGWGLDNIELGYRLFKKGYRFEYNKKASSYHLAHAKNLKKQKTDFLRNIRHFKNLHPSRDIELFESFLKGNLSIERFCSLAQKIKRKPKKETFYMEYRKLLQILKERDQTCSCP